MFYLVLGVFLLNAVLAYKNYSDGNYKSALLSMFGAGWMFGLLVRDIAEALVMNGTV